MLVLSSGMPVAEPTSLFTRPPTREVLLSKRRGWFFGLTGDQFVKYVFQGNAAVSIVVLALITFTIFKDAVGFLPQNHAKLVVYRLAGLEYVDIFREQVTAHSTMSRYLAQVRGQQLARLTKKEGLSPAAAAAQLAAFDSFASRFADTIGDEETLLGNMTDLATSLKDRQKVAEDLGEAKRNLLAAKRRRRNARHSSRRKWMRSGSRPSISSPRSNRCWRCGRRCWRPTSDSSRR